MSTVIKKHFIGRDAKFKISQNITGLSTQSGTPSQSNYVEVVPLLVDPVSGINIRSWNLHGVTGFSDSYDASIHKITRRYGMKVLTGTESYVWGNPSVSLNWSGMPRLDTSVRPICTRLQGVDGFTSGDQLMVHNATTLRFRMPGITGTDDAKAIIAAAYAEGKPFVVYYPRETPITEDAPPLIRTSIMMHLDGEVPKKIIQSIGETKTEVTD